MKYRYLARTQRAFPLVLLLLQFVAACASAPESTDEIASSGDSIVRGDLDSSNRCAAVARIVSPGGSCSGTLVTPKWVLTARHCIANSADEFAIKFGPNSNTATVTRRHTLAKSGMVPILTGQTVPASGNYAGWERLRGADLALIKLDDPIDPAQIAPVHPAMTGPIAADASTPIGTQRHATAACAAAFSPGLVVGYGPREFSRPTDNLPLDGLRSFAQWGDWHAQRTRCDYSAGRVVLDAMPWETIGYCGAYFEATSADPYYRGSGKGDSGGPLLLPVDAPNRVCGVASGVSQDTWKESWGVEPVSSTYTTAFYTAVDFHGPWLDQYIWNAKTQQYDGECEMRQGLLDSDGDGLPNGCDLCPNLNSKLNIDTDGDGIGDVCDHCNTVADRANRDSNLNVELALKELEHVDAYAQSRDKNHLTREFPGDACDTVLSVPRDPLGVVGEATPPASLNPRVYPRKFASGTAYTCMALPTANLESVPAHTNNVLQLESFAPSTSAEASGNTLLEHCACPAYATTTQCGKRDALNCDPHRDNSGRKFVRSSAADVSAATGDLTRVAWPRSTTRDRDLVPTTHPPTSRGGAVKNLAWAYWLDNARPETPFPPVPAPSAVGYDATLFEGVQAAWVHSYRAGSRPVFDRENGVTDKPNADRRTGWRRTTLREWASNVDDSRCGPQHKGVKAAAPELLGSACPMCAAVPGLLPSVLEVMNPVTTVAAGTAASSPLAGAELFSLSAGPVANANSTLVAADAFAAPAGATAAITKSGSGEATATLRTQATTPLRSVSPILRRMASPPPTAAAAPLGELLSATRDERAEFFETRVLYKSLAEGMDTMNAWPAGFRFGPILAGAYDLRNDGFLVIDVPSTSKTRLVWSPRFGTPSVFAEWSFARNPERITLGVAPSGELLISVSRGIRSKTLVIAWTPVALGRAVMLTHDGVVTGEPKLTSQGLEALELAGGVHTHTVLQTDRATSVGNGRAAIERTLRGLTP